MEWLKTAPKALVDAYDKKVIGNGRQHLQKLLTDDRMVNAWRQIEPPAGSRWDEVWQAITYAKSQSDRAKRRRRRGDERDSHLGIAKTALRLAARVERGPLDVLAYDLLPNDVLKALGVPDLPSRLPLERAGVAAELLRYWPSASELLRGLAHVAEKQAQHAMMRHRADERDVGDVAARVFAATLGEEFRLLLGGVKAGAVAIITNVILGSDIDKDLVRAALKKGGTKRG